jgi:hypothetical protein
MTRLLSRVIAVTEQSEKGGARRYVAYFIVAFLSVVVVVSIVTAAFPSQQMYLTEQGLDFRERCTGDGGTVEFDVQDKMKPHCVLSDGSSYPFNGTNYALYEQHRGKGYNLTNETV